MQLVYVIVFVDDMSAGVSFYRETLRLPLRFSSPHWSEFDTGATTLALHPLAEFMAACRNAVLVERTGCARGGASPGHW